MLKNVEEEGEINFPAFNKYKLYTQFKMCFFFWTTVSLLFDREWDREKVPSVR